MYNRKNILVTGGAGYIGSHSVVELFRSGYNPIIIDNFDNSEKWIIDRIEEILNEKIVHYQGSCQDTGLIDEIFENHKISGVIHFAAHKAVGESVDNPLKYYDNNIGSLIAILNASQKNQSKVVFSSSCTVYGTPATIPVDEFAPIQNAESPYGNTKIICENIIEDFVKSESKVNAISLRYFNPIGADSSSKIGELPIGTPSNLVPFITQTAANWREQLTVFGGDYSTPDGTCMRDYIHVTDLAKAHVKALDYMFEHNNQSFHEKFNIGTGNGSSVLELIKAFEKVTGEKLNYKIGEKRAGDVEAIFGNASKAESMLNWKAEKGLEEALLDSWNWQKTLTKP